MARIQILHLPPYGAGGEHPFALVVDRCEMPDEPLLSADALALPEVPDRMVSIPAAPVTVIDGWQEFGKQIGARGVLVTAETVDIVGEDAGGDVSVDFDHAALVESVSTALRFHLESPEASEALRARLAPGGDEQAQRQEGDR